MSRSYFPKQFPKPSLQNSCAKAAALQTYSPKVDPQLFSEVVPESCSAKLLPKAILRLFKAFVRSCRAKLLLLPKVVPQSRSSRLLSRAAPNSCSPKLLKLPSKVASKRSFPKLLLKLLPKAVVLQSNCSSRLLQSRKVAPHSCSTKLPSKVATESRVPKKLPKTARTG